MHFTPVSGNHCILQQSAFCLVKNCRQSSHLLADAPLFLSFLSLHSFYGSFLSEDSNVLSLYSKAPLALAVIMMMTINNLQSGVAVDGTRLAHVSLMCFYLKYYKHDNMIAFPCDVISLQRRPPSPGLCLETPPLQSPSTSTSTSTLVFSAQSPEKKEKSVKTQSL